jgi:hypothetical protein
MQLFRYCFYRSMVSYFNNPTPIIFRSLLDKSTTTPYIFAIKIAAKLFVWRKFFRTYFSIYFFYCLNTIFIIETFRYLFTPFTKCFFTYFKINIFQRWTHIISTANLLLLHSAIPIHTCHLPNFNCFSKRYINWAKRRPKLILII